MFARLLLPALLLFQALPQNPALSDKDAPIVAISARWYRDRQSAEKAVVPARGPDMPMIEPTRSIGRTQKPDGTAPERDPNFEKPEARSASLDKIGEEAGETSRVDGFTYEVKFRNGGTKQAQTIFWEYQFTETAVPENTSRRRFVCDIKIKPDKDRLVQVFSTLGPGTVITLKNLSKGSGKPFDESVVIDRIEFEDGTFWQRQDWNLEPARSSATKHADRSGICRSF